MLRSGLLPVLAAVMLHAQIPAPRNLHAASATSRAVALAWSASAGAKGYVVERKPVGAGQFAALNPTPIEDTQTTDSSIDAFTTYLYRVKAVDSAKLSSPVSNQITVGPPPVGLSIAAPVPAGLKEPQDVFGQLAQMTRDANGDPALAYYFVKGDHAADSTLCFVAWDGAAYHWRDAIEVAKPGAIDISRPALPFSLTRDATAGVFAIGFPTDRRENSTRSAAIAVSSDGGATWEIRRVATSPETAIGQVSIALGGGKAYVAWEQARGVQYAAGKLTDNPASWSKMAVPGTGGNRGHVWYPSLAIDGAGNPGLAVMMDSCNDYNTIAGFWRPGGQIAKVTDSANIQNDHPKVRLDFFGAKPRLAVDLVRTKPEPKTGWPNAVWAIAAKDDGDSWSEPVPVPWDGGEHLGRPEIAVGARDGVAILSDVPHSSGEGMCGHPKLSRSSDFFQWKTCSPLGSGKPKLNNSVPAAVRFAANGKLYIVLLNPVLDRSDPSPVGLLVWREP